MSAKWADPPVLQGKIKGALVQTRIAAFFPPHRGAEHGLKHVLLQTSYDRVTINQIKDRRMTFQDLGSALLFFGGELRHVAFGVAHLGEPFGAVRHGVALYARLKTGSFSFENVVEKLLRDIWAVAFLN